MERISFNDGWQYSRLGEGNFKPAFLPHDAMLRENRGNGNPSGTHGAWFEGYDYEYTKRFALDKELLSRRLDLKFEGVYREAEVYVNGEKAAYCPYGFGGFYAPLNAYAREGVNEVRVVARNADQPNCRWYAGAGIYRPVSLLVRPAGARLAIDGVKIRTLDYKTRETEVCFTVDQETELKNEGGRVAFTVLDADNGEEKILFAGEAETSGKTRFFLPDAELWSPENPKLYTLRADYCGDAREIKFGVRQIGVSRAAGFTLNGERVILCGACIHSDNGPLGAAAYPYADERKIRFMQKIGYNAVRCAHNPCSEATLAACDRLGMLVLDEYTDGWYIHKTRFDYATKIEERWKKDLADMVDKDYNHPCVVMYSIGNEVSETAEKKGIELTGKMTERLHDLDPARPVTCGVNIFFNFLSSLGFGVYSDEKAAKGEHIGSAFFNNLAGIFGDKTMKIGATLHGCDVKTRDAFAKTDVAGYNYGILRYKKDLKKYPARIILGSETFCNDAYRFYELAKKEPGVIGDFVWAGMDYLGEVGVGSWEYASYAEDFSPRAGWISAGSGRVDLTGRRLGEALYTRVAFGLAIVRMAVVPADDYGKKHSPSAWKMSNAFESWSWNGCEGRTTKAEVYARADYVRLELNGRQIARKRVKKKDCRVDFKVKYAPGTLTAIACRKDGKELGRVSLESAGENTALFALPESETIFSDSLAYIRLKYADDKGIWKPLARGEIAVRVEGGELLALGHGCPYNDKGYLRGRTDTYYGEALAIVRPTGGEIRLEADSPYGGARAVVRVKPRTEE